MKNEGNENLAFKIIEPDDYVTNRIKREYNIYFDGRIEGFGDRCIVINYILPKINVLKYFAQNMNKEYKKIIERCAMSDFLPLETLNNLYEQFQETIERI